MILNNMGLNQWLRCPLKTCPLKTCPLAPNRSQIPSVPTTSSTLEYAPPAVTPLGDGTATRVLPDSHLVFLVNFVAPNLLQVFRDLGKRCGKFTVVSSVPIEGNRQWQPETEGLDVRNQRTWTITRIARHPSGYREPNYIHVPLDTWGQLRKLKPDVVISLELGARTMFSAAYRTFKREVTHVAAVLASERSEAGRGGLRLAMRRSLIRRVDGLTFNGPSCKRYLMGLGADEKKLSPWDYAADPRKAYAGPLKAETGQPNPLKLLTVGQLSERKGVLQSLAILTEYAAANPNQKLHWSLVGDGPLVQAICEAMLPANLTLSLEGHCDPQQIQQHYQSHHVMLFPTLGDEWGLVVNESLASGLPVIGSCHSQAVETIVAPERNGFVFDPEQKASLAIAFDQFLRLSPSQRTTMRSVARQSVDERTPARSADQMIEAVYAAMMRRGFAPRTERRLLETAPMEAVPR